MRNVGKLSWDIRLNGKPLWHDLVDGLISKEIIKP
jgi:hypothetical protein